MALLILHIWDWLMRLRLMWIMIPPLILSIKCVFSNRSLPSLQLFKEQKIHFHPTSVELPFCTFNLLSAAFFVGSLCPLLQWFSTFQAVTPKWSYVNWGVEALHFVWLRSSCENSFIYMLTIFQIFDFFSWVIFYNVWPRFNSIVCWLDLNQWKVLKFVKKNP